jgi:hypothetical protein
MTGAERQKIYAQCAAIHDKIMQLICLPVEQRKTRQIQEQIDDLQYEHARLMSHALGIPVKELS